MSKAKKRQKRKTDKGHWDMKRERIKFEQYFQQSLTYSVLHFDGFSRVIEMARKHHRRMNKIERQKRERLSQLSPANKELKDVLEKKIEDLSRQLAEEKQTSRKEKLQVARLQREIARQKGNRENMGKDTNMKDLERERMLRINAEQRLQEMTVESDSCRTRLLSLQEEFKKMEEMVRNMLQYKSKIDQLKQEKSSLSITYENNVQKYRSHITNLERENIMLMNEVKRFESQMCGKIDDRGDKSKLLLERLKMLEAENSALVLENEQQRQQYEKCLDEIANQVVQALLAQKTLREECIKLQTRVQDLEYQNHHLNVMFQQKSKYSSDTVLQALPSTENASCSPLDTSSGYPPLYSSVTSLPTQTQISASISLSQTMQNLSPMSQYILQSAVAQRCVDHSTESLHSICSDYTCSDSIGKPKMITPPPWIEEKPNRNLSISSSNSAHSNADSADLTGYSCRTKIETEFPANNTSPKVKHVSVIERAKTRRSSSVTSLQGPARPKAVHTRSTSSLNKVIVPYGAIPVSNQGSTTSLDKKEVSVQTGKLSLPQKKVQTHVAQIHANNSGNSGKPITKPSRIQTTAQNSKTGIPTKTNKNTKLGVQSSQNSFSKIPLKNFKSEKDSKVSGRKNSNGNVSQASSQTSSKSATTTKSQVINPTRKNVPSENKSKDRLAALRETLGSPPRVPLLPNAQFLYDYSDEDSDINRPVSTNLNTGSTVSLNELLDDDEDTDTLLDEDFTAEHFAFFESPSFIKKETFKLENQLGKDKGRTPSDVSLHGKPDIIRDTENSELKNQGKSPVSPRKRVSSLQHVQVRRKNIQRPNSLVLPSKERHSLRHGYSSSSLDSSDSEENWSPQFARQHLLKMNQEKDSSSVNQNKVESKNKNLMSGTSPQDRALCSQDQARLSPLETVKHLANTQNLMNSNIMESTDSNSLSKKKGPPPPVPKKPVSGKRSPGIRMGLQSPGFRQNKKESASPINFKEQNPCSKLTDIKHEPVPQEIKYNFRNDQEIQNVMKQPPKYVSSDSSFESVKAEKVERSASRDDGYSTMSSDIQPEAMEKYSDNSLSRNEMVFFKKDISNKDTQTCLIKKESANSDQDSAMDSSTQSAELKHSSHSLSSQNSNSSDDRAPTIYGSLGRVKAMKSLFEAEAQKGTEKPVKFPLRKSPSYDSRFGNKDSSKANDIVQNRRSLGADFKIFPVENDSGMHEEKPVIEKTEDLKEDIPESSFKNDLIDIKQEQSEVDVSYFIQDKNEIFNSLNISEENFLSDIPEEKDEWETSAHSSLRQLENLPNKFPQIPVFRNNLYCLPPVSGIDPKIRRSSIREFSRTLSDSDLNHSSVSAKCFNDFDFRKLGIDKPLERSVSLSELYKRKKVSDLSFNIPLNLRRSLRQPLMDEQAVIGRAQDIVKSHILQQLSKFVESESEDDLEQFSFSSVLKRSKYNSNMDDSVKDKSDHLWNAKRTSLNLAIRRIYAGNIPQDKLSSNFDSFHGNILSQDKSHNFSDCVKSAVTTPDTEEDRSFDKGRQSSHECSPMPEGQTKFRSDYYSLCLVGSNRSLCSGSNEGESDIMEVSGVQNDSNSAKHSHEFDIISRQIENLSKTVNDLHKSLSSLNSCDSDNESNEDHSQMFMSPSENFRDTHGYHWVEDDEFYLTPGGGEIILGSSPFSNTGAGCEFVNEYADDTSCNDEFEYYGNFSSEQSPPFDVKQLYTQMKNDEKDFSDENSLSRHKLDQKDHFVKERQKTPRREREKNSDVKTKFAHGPRSVDDSMVIDPEIRAAMLDSMVHLSGASMDSLDDNIGVDQVMCSRLLGRGDKDGGPVRQASTPRPALDVSNLFFRYGESEQEAVAAFDFLDDISTSPATSQQEIPSKCQTEMDQSDNVFVVDCKQSTNQNKVEAQISIEQSQELDNSNSAQPMDQKANKNSANCKNSNSDKINKGSNRNKNKERSKIPKAIKQETNQTKSTRKSSTGSAGSGQRSSSNSSSESAVISSKNH